MFPKFLTNWNSKKKKYEKSSKKKKKIQISVNSKMETILKRYVLVITYKKLVVSSCFQFTFLIPKNGNKLVF